MKRFFLLLMVIFLLFLSQPVLYSATLTLKAIVNVSEDKVYLKDVLEDPSGIPDGFLLTELFPAPPIGRNMVYSSQYVKQIISMKLPSLVAGKDFSSPEKITFIRESQVVTYEELLPIVREKLNISDLELLSVNSSDIVLPAGNLEIDVKQLSSGNSNVIVVKVSFFVDGKSVKSINLSLKTNMKKVVYVASRYMQKGVLITEDMIAEKVIENIVPYAVEDKMDILGKVTTRIIYPGQIITDSSIAEEPLVSKNREVEAIKHTGSLTVTTVLIALQDGYLGQTIRLRNPDSFREVLGTVVGKDKVEVFR